MRGSSRRDFWSHTILSLILLAANIGAPFRSSTAGLAILLDHRQNVATGSVIRVRAVSSVGVSQGFRAVVGLAKGGPDTADLGAKSQAFSAFFPSSTDTLPFRQGVRPIAQPSPPLRC
jgi:hypothetical protein